MYRQAVAQTRTSYSNDTASGSLKPEHWQTRRRGVPQQQIVLLLLCRSLLARQASARAARHSVYVWFSFAKVDTRSSAARLPPLGNNLSTFPIQNVKLRVKQKAAPKNSSFWTYASQKKVTERFNFKDF